MNSPFNPRVSTTSCDKRGRGDAYALLIAAAAAIGGLLFGYDTAVASGAILFLRELFHLTSFETEIAVASVLAGALLGAAVAGYFADHFGRKPVLAVSGIIFGVFSLLTGMTNGLTAFVAARFLVGIAVGITSMITPLYIAELAPPKLRGAFVTLNQLAIVSGVGMAYYINYLFSATGNWRGMFISAVAPSLLMLLAVTFLPESPRWLASQGRFGEAFRIMCRIESVTDAEAHLSELREVVQVDRLKFLDLFAPHFRKALAVGVGLAIFQQLTGINTIIYYTPTILQIAGFRSASSAILATAFAGAIHLICTIVALFLLDRVGRRPLLLVSIAGMALSLVYLGYLFGETQVSRSAILIALFVYLGSFSIGLGPVFWLLISEIYPTAVRGQAMSLAALTIWVFDLLTTITFLSLLDALGARRLFWFYAAACVVAFYFSARKVPETKGHTLEEIESSWT